MDSPRPLLRLAAPLAILALFIPAATPVHAIPFDGKPKILVHLVPATTGASCQDGALPDCRNAVTTGALATPGVGPFYYGYLLVPRGILGGITSVALGIRYNDCDATYWKDRRGIDILSWTRCAVYEPPAGNPPWAKPGSSTYLTWMEPAAGCQIGEAAVAGYFYMAAYSPDTLRVTPPGSAPSASVTNCQSVNFNLSDADLGSVIFSEGGAVAGCNPCNEPCPPILSRCPPPPPPPPPPPIPRPGPQILLHVKAVTTKNACLYGQLQDPKLAVTNVDLSTSSGPFYFVYLLAGKGRLTDVAGLQCGITYENNLPGDEVNGHGIDIFGWTLCATLEFPTPGPNMWPKPGGGNLITWDPESSCQVGATAVAGYFYVAAYDPDRLRVIPRPVDGAAKVANCSAAETIVAEDDLGYASFSRNAEAAGCNPVLTPCAPEVPVVPSTWSGIKTLYGK